VGQVQPALQLRRPMEILPSTPPAVTNHFSLRTVFDSESGPCLHARPVLRSRRIRVRLARPCNKRYSIAVRIAADNPANKTDPCRFVRLRLGVLEVHSVPTKCQPSSRPVSKQCPRCCGNSTPALGADGTSVTCGGRLWALCLGAKDRLRFQSPAIYSFSPGVM